MRLAIRLAITIASLTVTLPVMVHTPGPSAGLIVNAIRPAPHRRASSRRGGLAFRALLVPRISRRTKPLGGSISARGILGVAEASSRLKVITCASLGSGYRLRIEAAVFINKDVRTGGAD